MIGLRSSYKRKLYNENSYKNPKNELDGGSTYAIGRKVYLNKSYEPLLSKNLPANNSSNNSRRLNRFKYESGPNPKPLNNYSSGMRIQLLKLNTIGRASLSHKIKRKIIEQPTSTDDTLTNIDNFDNLIQTLNNNNIAEDRIFEFILFNNVNKLLEENNQELSNNLEDEIKRYIYPWLESDTSTSTSTSTHSNINNYSINTILIFDYYNNDDDDLEKAAINLIYPWIQDV
tara:strand:- start:1227 stop:1916 length:690 start_codon:yes stop_codon:yes gene_type:complete